MKKVIFSLIAICFLSASGYGQINDNFDPVDDKIMKARKDFFTKELSLSQNELQKFWPLYESFQLERDKIAKKYQAPKRFQFMTDKEVEEFLMKNFQKEEEFLSLKKDYFQRFKEALPIRKVAAINQAENKFKRRLLEEMRKRRANPRGFGKRPRN